MFKLDKSTATFQIGLLKSDVSYVTFLVEHFKNMIFHFSHFMNAFQIFQFVSFNLDALTQTFQILCSNKCFISDISNCEFQFRLFSLCNVNSNVSNRIIYMYFNTEISNILFNSNISLWRFNFDDSLTWTWTIQPWCFNSDISTQRCSFGSSSWTLQDAFSKWCSVFSPLKKRDPEKIK